MYTYKRLFIKVFTISFIIICVFQTNVSAQKVTYHVINDEPPKFCMPTGLIAFSLPYRSEERGKGIYGLSVMPEYYGEKFSFYGSFNYGYNLDYKTTSGYMEAGGMFNFISSIKDVKKSVNLKSEHAGYNKKRVTYIEVPAKARLIHGIRAGAVTSRYAEEVYVGYGFVRLQKVSISAIGYGNRTTKSYFRFSADIFRTLHRADFYSYYLIREEETYNADIEGREYKTPPPIGFRCAAALAYNNLMVVFEAGKRDHGFFAATIQYFICPDTK